MERLTKCGHKEQTILVGTSCAYGCMSYDCQLEEGKKLLKLALDKLAEYENLEEQGRLIKLPCKVGDTVWQIMVVGVQGKNIKYGIFKAIVTKISVDYQMNFLLSTITEDEKRYRNEVTSTAIGDTMFFTKSEAEAKLKELRGAENGN